jgi:hypothetical protein
MQDVVTYNVTDAAIAEMKSQYMGLVVKDLNDDRGLAEVHRARMIVKGKRVDVEKRRIVALLTTIETHLENEENKVTQEKARIKAEIERKAQETAQRRIDSMARVGVSLPFLQAKDMAESDFSAILKEATEAWESEQVRIAEEKRKADAQAAADKKAREEEAAKLAAERAEIERIRAEEQRKRMIEEEKQRAERNKIEAERREVENARRKIEHEAAVEQAKKEATEKALKDAAEKAEREAREKAEAEQKVKDEAARQERIKPVKIKLLHYAERIIEVAQPDITTEPAKTIIEETQRRLFAIKKYIIKAAQDL